MVSDARSLGMLRVKLTGTGPDAASLGASLRGTAGLEVVDDSRDSVYGEQPGAFDVVLHVASETAMLAAELGVLRHESDAPIVVAVTSDSDQVLARLAHEQVADVLLLPQPPEAIAFTLRKVSRAVGSESSADAPGQILVFFSPKGGAGKTVTATNVAAALAGLGSKTLLIDFDLEFGDAAIMLGLNPRATLFDLVGAAGTLDREKLEAFVTQHPGGLSLLAAPERPEEGERVGEADLRMILDVAKQSYEFVIVDTAPAFDKPMLTALEASDRLFVLCGQDVPTLKNVRIGLETLDLLRYPRTQVSLVFNRAGGPGAVTQSEVEAALNSSVEAVLPEDPAVRVSVNRGRPVVLTEGRSGYSRAVMALSRQIGGLPAHPHRRRGMLGLRRTNS